MSKPNPITTCRRAVGLTQPQLARKLRVSQQAVSAWERGIAKPAVRLIPRLAKVLKVSAETLA